MFDQITVFSAVDVVQSVEHQIVVLVVAGSSPVIHPSAAGPLRRRLAPAAVGDLPLTFGDVLLIVLPTVGLTETLRP
jgi:hypothetical protein